jgi:hypothetical protein
MGLKDWMVKKAKEKQGKNVIEAAGQALSFLQFAMGPVSNREGRIETVFENPAIKTTVDRHVERVAGFCGGPMDADELWREVFEPMIGNSEQMFDEPTARLLNDMLRSAYHRAVETGVVRRGGSNG